MWRTFLLLLCTYFNVPIKSKKKIISILRYLRKSNEIKSTYLVNVRIDGDSFASKC